MTSKADSHPVFIASWAVATSICFWFLWIHAPAFLAAKDYIRPLLYVHLIGAYSVYLVCVHNTILTPSKFDGAARPFHVWFGRLGLVLGVVGFLTGFVLVWIVSDYAENLGFSIGVTFGGFAQMYAEVAGYIAIKRFQTIKARIAEAEGGLYENDDDDEVELSALRNDRDEQLTIHVRSMVNLFALACGIPAMMRICDSIGYNYLPILLGIAFGLSYFMARPLVKKITSRRSLEEYTASLSDGGYVSIDESAIMAGDRKGVDTTY